MAAPGLVGTTGRSGSSLRTTSSALGGATACRTAAIWSGSMRRFSCIRGSGRRAVIWTTSPIRWSTARCAKGAFARTNSRTRAARKSRRSSLGSMTLAQLTEARMFNLMFKTFMGPVEDDAAVAYLRPETAQGIFVNFENVQQSMRLKLPFGIAQIGKSFRNEITPGNFTFRTREFEQMEIEFFVMPGTDEDWHQRWLDERFAWYPKYGIRKENLRLREHEKDELAHYAKRTADIEYLFPMGWSELEGIANRTDFDLKQHAQFSGKTLEYFDEESKQKVVPFVIEPSAGADRGTLAFLVDAYREEEVKGEKRVVLNFHPELAPIKIAVLPLLKKNPRIVETAHKLCADLRKRWHSVYDDTASIGRLYRRQDEVGTPFCVTVDVQTVGDEKSAADDKVTIRDRDNMQQIRVPLGVADRSHGKIHGRRMGGDSSPAWRDARLRTLDSDTLPQVQRRQVRMGTKNHLVLTGKLVCRSFASLREIFLISLPAMPSLNSSW